MACAIQPKGRAMNKPILNIADIELQPRPAAMAPTGAAAGRYEARMGLIGQRLGARKLGYNLTAIAPGKRAFPFHNHRCNEEMFFVVEGEGEVRIGEAVFSIRKGDIIACPAGAKEKAHQIINTGSVELKFLAVSTRLSPDIVEYPDSGKFGVLAEYPSGADGRPGVFRYIGRESASLGYWEGE
jgi:uncharacterized cupin superfamily protein